MSGVGSEGDCGGEGGVDGGQNKEEGRERAVKGGVEPTLDGGRGAEPTLELTLDPTLEPALEPTLDDAAEGRCMVVTGSLLTACVANATQAAATALTWFKSGASWPSMVSRAESAKQSSSTPIPNKPQLDMLPRCRGAPSSTSTSSTATRPYPKPGDPRPPSTAIGGVPKSLFLLWH